LSIGRGDKVITQAFTFVATVEAIVESGATPVCVEIDETLNMSAEYLEEAIDEHVKAIIVVHMLGTPARMKQILCVARKRGIPVIEDTAWGIGGTYDGQYLGTLGEIGTYSFDFAKTITTGEGGMVVTNNSDLDFKARAWHDHGHENNPLVPRWEDTRHSSGFNFRMSELTAAVGLGQLSKLETIVAAHRSNAQAIWDRIRHLEYLERRVCDSEAAETSESLVIRVPDPSIGARLKEHLNTQGVSTKILPEAITWHFAKYWSHIPELELPSPLEISETILKSSISLPISFHYDEAHCQLIQAAMESFQC
jgi:8-amino-3,8-dideoxy-alpha-D-manno-octulosonate transaminase